MLIKTGFCPQIIGSSDLQTSVANTEIIPTGKTINEFSLTIDANCHIIFNGGSAIYYRANTTLQYDSVFSVKIVENGITFNWSGCVS